MIAALLSFSTLGVFHKVADVKKCRPAAVNALIYVWSLLFALLVVMAVQRSSPAAPVPVAAIAIPFGVSASIAILAFQAGIRHGDIATSWLAINLSSAIPTIASILIYGESLTTRKTIALTLIPVSMALLWVDKRRSERAREEARAGAGVKRDSGVWIRLMLLAFVTNGLGPFGLKVLDEKGYASYQPQYLVFWYLGGAVFGVLAFLPGVKETRAREIVLGALMGLCSLSGQTFTGLSLAHGLPGHVVFPITTGGSLFLVAGAGIFVFKEKVGGYGAAGIVLGVLALIMLSVA